MKEQLELRKVLSVVRDLIKDGDFVEALKVLDEALK